MTRGQALLGTVCVVAGCWSEGPMIDDTFTLDEWMFLRTEFQMPTRQGCPEQFTQENCGLAVAFGRALFFDTSLSGPVLIDDPAAPGSLDDQKTLSCAGCHDPNNYFIDTRSRPHNVSIGAAPKRTKHNALSVLNLAYKGALADRDCKDPDDALCKRVFSWTGKYDDAGAVLNIAGPNAMNTKPEQAARAIVNGPLLPAYQQLFGATPQICSLDPRGAALESTYTCIPCMVGDPTCHDAATVFANLALVFDAYLRTLNSTDSPFDHYIDSAWVDGQTTPKVDGFGDAERRGLSVFIGKGMCIDCHRGPLFSDQKFHNTGVPQTGENVLSVDGGLGDEPFSTEQHLGEFLTPSLRHVAKTAPYMHAGQFDSLGDVIDFYRSGGRAEGFSGIKDGRIQPLEITDDEARDLEAFLISLTGTDDKDGAWAAP